MKLVLGEIDHIFSIGERKIPSLVVKHPACFRRICRDLSLQCMGEEGDSVLSIEDRIVPISKHVELVREFDPFSLRQKSLIHALQGYMVHRALDEERFLQTQELFSAVENWIYDLSGDLPIDVQGNKLSALALIKSVDPLPVEEGSPLERFLDYMELWREIGEERLFVAVQMRSYFSEEELAPFIETVSAHQYRLLMIDTWEGEQFPLENRLTVDEDLVEFDS